MFVKEIKEKIQLKSKESKNQIHLDINLIVFSLVGLSLLLLLSNNLVLALPLFFQFLVSIYFLVFFPILLGYISFNQVLNKFLNLKNKYWIKISFFFVLGLILLNIPYFLNSYSYFGFYPPLIVAILVIGFYFIYILGNYNQNRYLVLDLTKQQIQHFLPIFFFLLISCLPVIIWGSKIGFVTTQPDNLQNLHLANILNNQEYALFGSQLTPMYRVSFYTNSLIPVLSLSSFFFQTPFILSLMFWVELLGNPLIFLQRRGFFRDYFNLKQNNLTAEVLSLFSVFLSSRLIFLPGSYLNQQIIVLLFPCLLFFLKNRNLKAWSLTFLLGLPFHFIISTLAILL